MKLTTNILGSLIFIGLSLFIIYVIPDQILASQSTGINAQSFPRWIAILMLISSFVLLFSEIRIQFKNAKLTSARFNFELKKEFRALIFVILITAFALSTPMIGFLFSSIGFSTLSLIFFKIKDPRYYIFLIGCCIVINYIFKSLLLVQLP